MTMKSIEQLVDINEHAWQEIQDVLNQGETPYTILPKKDLQAQTTLLQMQITTKSYLGCIAYETGGILFDQGWIKLLGSGNEHIYGDLLSWNGQSQPESGASIITQPLTKALIVAYDVVGGFFALNGGGLGEQASIYYFAPDTLEWEDTELSYSEFVIWLASGRLSQFYETMRWNGWQDDISALSPDRAIHFYPPLWTQEGSTDQSSKKAVPVAEFWNMNIVGK
ncbi:DUF2625 domain-containing protein [Paenibacillus sp. CFBP13512]|uniref:DUF2625 family protein n=1 Tax=Paenibacillus sp. CFBP13512 TaxID=2184007 RepID=UPI0010C0B151|nr:DUF2625 family protein [Paenibacillus sp. CFBP13512]TKJ92766.1 DUF2625 domain-containing protein [Paenibacillus sp. CFBP13512]